MISYYIEHDKGDANNWPDWQAVDEATFCAIANKYEIDKAESLWRVYVYLDEENSGLRLMLCEKG